MSEILPFSPCMSTDIDVSSVGSNEALSVWYDVHGTYPTVLWVNPHDLGDAEKVILLAPEGSMVRRLTPIPDPRYKHDWWSVGTHLHKGFGSVGA